MSSSISDKRSTIDINWLEDYVGSERKYAVISILSSSKFTYEPGGNLAVWFFLIVVYDKSVHRTHSRRMKFCVHGGLGDSLNKQRRKPNGYPGALLAIYSIPHRKTVFVACSFDFGRKKRLQPPRAEISRFPYCEVAPLLFRLPLSLLPLRLYSVCPYCSYRLAARQTTAVRWIFRVAVRKEKLIYRNMMPGHKIIEHL